MCTAIAKTPQPANIRNIVGQEYAPNKLVETFQFMDNSRNYASTSGWGQEDSCNYYESSETKVLFAIEREHMPP